MVSFDGMASTDVMASTRTDDEEITMLDDQTWHHEVSYERLIPVHPELVWRALTELRLTDMPITRALFWLRRLPGYVVGKRFGSAQTALLDGVRQARSGSVLSYDEPNLVEIGRIARFWQVAPTNGPVVADRAAFAAFAEPGYAKAVVSIKLTPKDSGTLVVTTTRIVATDESARRKFALYWRVIKSGSGATRRAMLAAAERRALALSAEGA